MFATALVSGLIHSLIVIAIVSAFFSYQTVPSLVILATCCALDVIKVLTLKLLVARSKLHFNPGNLAATMTATDHEVHCPPGQTVEEALEKGENTDGILGLGIPSLEEGSIAKWQLECEAQEKRCSATDFLGQTLSRFRSKSPTKHSGSTKMNFNDEAAKSEEAIEVVAVNDPSACTAQPPEGFHTDSTLSSLSATHCGGGEVRDSISAPPSIAASSHCGLLPHHPTHERPSATLRFQALLASARRTVPQDQTTVDTLSSEPVSGSEGLTTTTTNTTKFGLEPSDVSNSDPCLPPILATLASSATSYCPSSSQKSQTSLSYLFVPYFSTIIIVEPDDVHRHYLTSLFTFELGFGQANVISCATELDALCGAFSVTQPTCSPLVTSQKNREKCEDDGRIALVLISLDALFVTEEESGPAENQNEQQQQTPQEDKIREGRTRRRRIQDDFVHNLILLFGSNPLVLGMVRPALLSSVTARDGETICAPYVRNVLARPVAKKQLVDILEDVILKANELKIGQ